MVTTATPVSAAQVKNSPAVGACTTGVVNRAPIEALTAAESGVAVATTSAKAEVSFWAARYPRPLALLLGAEGAGLPADVIAGGDLQVRIPMSGTAESLNLAVAAGLLLYQARKPGLS